MEKFESLVLGVALMILIIAFIITGVMITNYSKSGEYPSTSGTCPDYWKLLSVNEYADAMDLDEDEKGELKVPVSTCSSSAKTGISCSGGTGYRAFCYDKHGLANDDIDTDSDTEYITHKIPKNISVYPNKIVVFSKKSEICDSIIGENTIKGKKSWADLNGLTWDGVTNTNKCDLKKDTSGVTTLI